MKSQIRINAEKDELYLPYCLRCPGNVRMMKIVPFFWRCRCGAEQDERLPELDARQTGAQIAALLRKLAHDMPSDLMGNGFDEECDETRLREQIEAAAQQLEEPQSPSFSPGEVQHLLAVSISFANGYGTVSARAKAIVQHAVWNKENATPVKKAKKPRARRAVQRCVTCREPWTGGGRCGDCERSNGPLR